MKMKKEPVKILQAAINQLSNALTPKDRYDRYSKYQFLGLDYTYDRSACVGCEDYCRCTSIINATVSELDFNRLVTAFIESIKGRNTISNEIDEYCIDRIFHASKLKDKGSWIVDVGGGYYGQEVFGCSPNPKVIEKLIDTLKSMLELSDIDKVKACLKEEYGYVLLQLQELKEAAVISVLPSVIEMGNDTYARKLEKEYVEQYNKYELPRGIVIVNGKDKYRLLDGYHRMTSAINQALKKIKVIVLQ